MPIDRETADWILAEVNGLVDGAGVGFVKVRVGGRQVKRVFVNASTEPPRLRRIRQARGEPARIGSVRPNAAS